MHDIKTFQSKRIRRIFYEEQWYFAVVDVVELLSGSGNPRRYWSDLKRKLKKEGYYELYEEIVQLKLDNRGHVPISIVFDNVKTFLGA